ncbi:MAG TPA: hypothetical protein VIO11_00615 [Candidatus Methanoperedens sp.]
MQTASAQIIKIPLTLYHYAISQTVSAESEATFKELKINYLQNRTRMTRITRIFTDIVNPRASVSSAQSVFNPKNPDNHVSAFICVHLRPNHTGLLAGGLL